MASSTSKSTAASKKAQGEDQMTIKINAEEFWPLSGKPYAMFFLTKSQVGPTDHMVLPEKLNSVLPSAQVVAVITYCGKNWVMTFNGLRPNRNELTKGWKKFVHGNNLKEGDGCVFELIKWNSKTIKFRAQILRGDLPPEFRDRRGRGSADNPITID